MLVKHPFYIRLAAILLSALLILVFLHEGRTIIIPLFFSVLIAFMLLPLTKWFERRRFPRSMAALSALLLFIIALGGVCFFFGAQTTDFARDLPELGVRIQGWTVNLQDWIARKFEVDASHQLQYLNKAAADFARYASVIIQALLLAVTGFAIWTVFVFIFTYFILTHRTLLRNFITCLFHRDDQPQVIEVLGEVRVLANGYIVGLLTEMVVVAVLNIAAFFIFGIKYALLLGVLAAVLNIIPYLGIYTAAGIAGIITLSNSTPNHALVAIIILVVIHFIDANILMPRIVGSRVKMNPLITIIAVLAGSLLWGIAGMFLFIPLAGILKIVFERVDGFKPWAILMGTEEEAAADPPKEEGGQTGGPVAAAVPE